MEFGEAVATMAGAVPGAGCRASSRRGDEAFGDWGRTPRPALGRPFAGGYPPGAASRRPDGTRAPEGHSIQGLKSLANIGCPSGAKVTTRHPNLSNVKA